MSSDSDNDEFMHEEHSRKGGMPPGFDVTSKVGPAGHPSSSGEAQTSDYGQEKPMSDFEEAGRPPSSDDEAQTSGNGQGEKEGGQLHGQSDQSARIAEPANWNRWTKWNREDKEYTLYTVSDTPFSPLNLGDPDKNGIYKCESPHNVCLVEKDEKDEQDSKRWLRPGQEKPLTTKCVVEVNSDANGAPSVQRYTPLPSSNPKVIARWIAYNWNVLCKKRSTGATTQCKYLRPAELRQCIYAWAKVDHHAAHMYFDATMDWLREEGSGNKDNAENMCVYTLVMLAYGDGEVVHCLPPRDMGTLPMKVQDLVSHADALPL